MHVLLLPTTPNQKKGSEIEPDVLTTISPSMATLGADMRRDNVRLGAIFPPPPPLCFFISTELPSTAPADSRQAQQFPILGGILTCVVALEVLVCLLLHVRVLCWSTVARSPPCGADVPMRYAILQYAGHRHDIDRGYRIHDVEALSV